MNSAVSRAHYRGEQQSHWVKPSWSFPVLILVPTIFNFSWIWFHKQQQCASLDGWRGCKAAAEAGPFRVRIFFQVFLANAFWSYMVVPMMFLKQTRITELFCHHFSNQRCFRGITAIGLPPLLFTKGISGRTHPNNIPEAVTHTPQRFATFMELHTEAIRKPESDVYFIARIPNFRDLSSYLWAL